MKNNISKTQIKDYYFDDFTEVNYRRLLKMCKKNYDFISYIDWKKDGRNVLWRHDIDISAHRARRLAQIEAEENVISTYFIYLHSKFYNTFENEVIQCLFEIINLGHNIGLHFDPNFYNLNSAEADREQLLSFINLEKDILEKVLCKKITVFSFHIPDRGDWLRINEENISGIINTYSAAIKSKYTYCSDSDGYWRFKRLENILEKADAANLQVLTHPVWWVPEIMSPRERVSRAIEGRAKSQHKYYDTLLSELCRENIS